MLQCNVVRGEPESKRLISTRATGLARKWKSDTFDDVPDGQYVVSGAYELLSTGRLSTSNADHPTRRRKGSFSEVHLTSCIASHRLAAADQRLKIYACTQAMLDTGIPLTSAYATCFGHEPPITNNTASFRGTLDYIWYAGADDFSVASVLEMPYPDTALTPCDIQLAPMPDQTFPSDHLAIAARLHVHARTPGVAAM